MRIKLLLGMLFLTITTAVLAENFVLTSPDFKNNAAIPSLFTCEGKNLPPTLTWQGIPKNTQALVLTMDDPDAAGESLVHWLIFNIPPSITSLNSNDPLPTGAISGMNGLDKLGYHGPCPPKGYHHYIFTLYALKKPLTVNSSVHKIDILNAMKGLVIKKARIIGIYQKINPTPKPEPQANTSVNNGLN